MRSLPLLALLLSATAASSSIHPISFTHGATGDLAVLHGYYNPNFGQGYTGFSLNFESLGYPPQPADVHVVPTLPDLPEAHWVSPPNPFASYKLEVPVWSTPPAENGNWESFAMELHATLSVNAFTPGGANAKVVLEFETTELMECSFSGLYFQNPDNDFPMTPPVDFDGRLLPGHHIIVGERWIGPGQSGTEEATFSLILGPVPVDTDQDGLSDYDEITTYHTDPNKTDTDGDGIDDKEEIRIHHTLPTNPDSDGDGFTDSFEISSGKSPLDPLSAPAASLTIHQAVELRVITKLGTNYRVQSSTDLQVWTDTETLIEGNGGEIKRLFEAVEGGARYWRVREVE